MIDQLVYVQIPKRSENSTIKKMIYKLLKVFYGLKQIPRLWYKPFSQFLLEKLGLKWINANHSIFVTSSGINALIVNTFIDNIQVMDIKKSDHIEKIKIKLAIAFKMVNIGPISFYLRLKVEKD